MNKKLYLMMKVSVLLCVYYCSISYSNPNIIVLGNVSVSSLQLTVN